VSIWAIVAFVRPGKVYERKAVMAESLAIVSGVKIEPSSAFQPMMTLIFLENPPVFTRVEGASGMKSLSTTG
jgi:hypothetical protein